MSNQPEALLPVAAKEALLVAKQRVALLSAPTAEDAAVTIIIPTSGRATLSRTLKSLQSQTNKNWRAILVVVEEHSPQTACLLAEGVGAKPITLQSSAPEFFQAKLGHELQKETRLSFAVLPFSGYDFYNNAGGQRNAVFHLVETDWAAFVDDDDTLGPSFVADLLNEWEINPLADAIIFRMSCEKCFSQIIPRPLEDATNFALNYVGISFALRRDTVLVDDRYHFRDSCGEDFDLLARLRHARKMVIISPSVLYFVKDFRPVALSPGQSYKRVVIQRKIGAPSSSDALFDFAKECSHQREKFKKLYEEACIKAPQMVWTKKCLCRPCGDWTCYRQRYPDISTLTDLRTMPPNTIRT
jgi:glycosyltransferase involved in cell wall biosynthesis